MNEQMNEAMNELDKIVRQWVKDSAETDESVEDEAANEEIYSPYQGA